MINSRNKILVTLFIVIIFSLFMVSCGDDGEHWKGKYGLDLDSYLKPVVEKEGKVYDDLSNGEKSRLRTDAEKYLKDEVNAYMIIEMKSDKSIVAKADEREYDGKINEINDKRLFLEINNKKYEVEIQDNSFILSINELRLKYVKVHRLLSDAHQKGIKYDFKFRLFTPEHLITLLVIVILVIIIVQIMKRIKSETGRKIFRYSFAIILLLQELLYMSWKVWRGTFDIGFDLPFQISRVSIYLCFIMLITKRYGLFEIAYFYAVGSVHAIITPNLSYSFPHVNFLFFFISHGGLYVAIYYMVFVEKYEPTVRSFWKSVIISLSIVALMIPINLITGGNYLYIMNQPSEDTGATTTLDLFGPWPIYIIFIILIGFVTLMLVGLLPFLIKYKVLKKNDEQAIRSHRDLKRN